jgi:hypothetical protein
MKLPWSRKEEIKELQEEIRELEKELEKLEEEKDSYKQRFKAEKDRRSKLAAKKQEAEKKLKKTKQKNTSQQENRKETKNKSQGQDITVETVQNILQKLETYSSSEKDFVTVYSPKKANNLPDFKGLKNSITKNQYEFLSDNSYAAFIEPDVVKIKLKTRPFFQPNWKIQKQFQTQKLADFISKTKQWAVISAGNTKIVQEENGEVKEVVEIKSRVDRKQKKGGFSQSRFERKREEQIDEHLNQVEQKIDEETYLVGEERLCKELPGQYLGGFDGSRALIDALYSFQLERMTEV